jgi:hypothetical protein
MTTTPQTAKPELTPDQKRAKRDYRAAIRLEWQKIVARKRFTSYEYKLIDGWFAKGVDTDVIVRAIHDAVERAKARSLTVYSIGFVTEDIFRIQRVRARMNVGGSQPVEGWRARADEALEEIALTSGPEISAMINELRRDLPALSREEVERRYRAINEKR